MSRSKLISPDKEEQDRIRWRSHEVTRIEAFSDAVIAFSVTLLIVSLEVPESFKDLMHNMAGFLPFAVCFLLLFYIWKTQHIFFRRYNLHDSLTYNLNGILLFVLLFFVYPLKYLSVYTLHVFRDQHELLNGPEFTRLMCIYSSGYMAIFLLFACMYRNAYRKREELQLTPAEVFETRTNIYLHLLMAGFGGLSILLAIISYRLLPVSGFIYAFVGIAISLLYRNRNRRFREQFRAAPALRANVPADEELAV